MPDAVRTSFPLLFVQTPDCPKQLDVELTANVAVSAVCEPVRPKIVTVDPDPKVMLTIKVTVKVFIAPETEVLCSMIEMRNLGTITTFRGCVPFATPERDRSFFVIGDCSIYETMVPAFLISAHTRTSGDGWLVSGLIRSNVNV
jgi:hypothetical protein